MKKIQLLLLPLIMGLITTTAQAQSQDTRPNIVIILADDLGFTDLKSYGSEIDTPNLDALANEGIRFSNHHVSASCAPTRAMLLTGVDSHRAGVGNIAEAKTESQSGSPFYNGTLNDNVVTIASLLKDTGYHTYMAGKWHLGYKDKKLRPFNRGFEETVMMPYSGADNWEQKPYLPNYRTVEWFANGENITLPDDFYSSKFIVDNTIDFIDKNKEDNKPFFSYVAFQAVHIPVQAPKAFTDKYIGTYDDGWSELKDKRQKNVKALGLIPDNTPVKTIRTTRDWEALSKDEKKFHSKSMAVYAGMVDAMDYNIGRLVEYLKSIDEYDNTIFVFTSDNGAEASDPQEVSAVFPLWMKYEDYNNDYETLGEKGSYNYIGASFASAAVGPLGHYKFYSGEGGLRVPMIISGKGLSPELKGSLNHSFTFVKDLAPTVLQLAQTAQPGTQYKGKTIEPITGTSLMPILSNNTQSIRKKDEVIAYEIGGNAALFKNNYKLVFNRAPVGDEEWFLYDLSTDPGETKDLKDALPDIFTNLRSAYTQYELDNGVLPVPDDYDQRRQVIKNAYETLFYKPIRDFFSNLI